MDYFKIWHFVVNKSQNKFYNIYIGRPSKWSNPFDYRENTNAKFLVTSRAEAISQYEQWIRSQPDFIREIQRELRGKILCCHCSPKLCHGHILAWIANEEKTS